MTGGGDTGELEEDGIGTESEDEIEARNESDEDGQGIAPFTRDFDLNLTDLNPTAGASDIGGRAGGD